MPRFHRNMLPDTVSHVAKNHYEFKDITSQSPGDAVIELNERFREHGVGYQFESEEIIRIDSQLIQLMS